MMKGLDFFCAPKVCVFASANFLIKWPTVRVSWESLFGFFTHDWRDDNMVPKE